MSRVGKKMIVIPGNVKITIGNDTISIEGPKGKLEHKIPAPLKVKQADNTLVIERTSAAQSDAAIHGLTRTIVSNMIKGVTEGYKKELEIKGVGFKAQAQGNTLQLTLGFSHTIHHPVPEGITVTAPKPTQITIEGIDKVKVGEAAADIRSYFKAEPYTGKGIRYVGEYVRHKAGKTVVK